jgi:hypothetical protein
LVWEVMSVGLGGYVSCPLHCGCNNIWFGRVLLLSTALWLRQHLVWEVMSVVHCTVAATSSGLGGYFCCPLNCGCNNIWFGRVLLFAELWLQQHLVWEVMSFVRCTVAATTSGLGGYFCCPLHCGCNSIWFGRLLH